MDYKKNVPWRYFKIFKGDMYSENIYVKQIQENNFSSPLLIYFKYNQEI